MIHLVAFSTLGTSLPPDVKEHINDSDPYHIRYIRFIIDHYDDSDLDYVIFLRENPEEHMTLSKDAFLRTLTTEPSILLDKTQWLRSMKCAPDGRPHHNGLEVGNWYLKLGLGASPQDVFEFVAGAQFLVPKSKIRARPKAFYEGLLTHAQTGTICQYTLERLWQCILG